MTAVASWLPLVVLGCLTGAATLIGGALALRFRSALGLFLGFSSGAVIGVALFDLLPEALELGRPIYSPLGVTTAMGVGFVIYLALDRLSLAWTSGPGSRRGQFGPASLTVHSLIDGLAIGLAFQVSQGVGLVVGLAVLAHDILDGANTVTLSLAGGSSTPTAHRWLVADAAAPLCGIGLAHVLSMPRAVLCLLLAVFGGVFLYIGASELLPRSSRRPASPDHTGRNPGGIRGDLRRRARRVRLKVDHRRSSRQTLRGARTRHRRGDEMTAATPPACDAAGARSRPPGAKAEHPRLVLATTILASSLAFVDGSVVNVGLPAIGRGLSADAGALPWVIDAYLLPLRALLLFGGAVGDRFGRRRVLIGGTALFAAASLACTSAPTLGLLLAARGAQGIGAAMLMPDSLAILGVAFSGEAKGRAIGLWAATGAAMGALGPVLGGGLIDLGSWRAIFLINLPLALGAILLAWRFVPRDADGADQPLDWTGGVLKHAGCVLLSTATNLSEASAAKTAGIDAVIAQGWEAGGHRGVFDPELPTPSWERWR